MSTMKKIKLFQGLWGCSADGTLRNPSCTWSIKLPYKVASTIHRFLNKFAYLGLEGTYLFRQKGV